MSNTPKVYAPKKVRPSIKLNLSKSQRVPWTEKQKDLIGALTKRCKFTDEEKMGVGNKELRPVRNRCSFVSGVAGTSKTFTSVYSALKLLDAGAIEKIIYVRSAVGSSPNGVGFLKGTLEDKLSVFKNPLNDKLSELLSDPDIKILEDKGYISMESTEYLRGRNLANSCVIIDEAQNLCYHELKTIISRVAENSRIWFLYDPKQSDLNNKSKNDMVKFANIFKGDEFENKLNGIVHFEFTKEDIVRSEFCRYVMEKIEDHEEELESRKQLENEPKLDWDVVGSDNRPRFPEGKILPEPPEGTLGVLGTLRDKLVETWSPSS